MNAAQFQFTDYVMVVGYFAIVIAVGLYFRGYMRQAKDYFTGGNQVPWWLAGISYYMTTFSAFAFVAYGEVAYLYGWVAVTISWVAVPACLIAAFWIAQKWRRARVSTPVEFLETRYSPFFRQLFAWTGFPLRLADNGLRIYSLGVFVSVAAGLDIMAAVIVSGLVLLAYTFMGGLWAVAVTDFVQGIVLFVALLIIFPLAFVQGGGFEYLVANAPSVDYLSLWNSPYSLAYVLATFVLIALNYNAGWGLVQRFYSVKDEKEARKVGLLAAGLHVIGPPIFYLPLMLTRDLLPALESSRYVYVAMALELLPVGMMGIVITAMIAATMSSLSSEYNVLASVATRDIYSRLFKRDANERHLLAVGKLFTILIGLVIMGVGVIVVLYPDTPLFSMMVTIFGVAVAPMMLPLLGGLVFPQLTLRGATFGFVVGLIVGFSTLGIQTMYLPTLDGIDPEWITFQFGAYAIFINVGTTILAMAAWTLIETKNPAETSRIDAFFARMRTPLSADEIAPSTDETAPSPFFIAGAAVIGIGVLLLVSFFTLSTTGRWINLGAGLALCLVGWLFYRKRPSAAALAREKERSTV